MAPPSPRRSSRARATNSQSQQSSGASSTSGRLERSTRSVNKPSSTKSTPTASLSSESPDDLDDTLLGRRRKRGQDDDTDKTSRSDNLDMQIGSDELPEEEDEAVRCICGAEDYPGRPPVEGSDASFFAAIELTEDVTGFFVQCDVCKVWQHGACVGIFSAESSPDEYFCEQCRRDLHKIHTAINGQKYSKYVPLHRPSRSASRATSIVKEGTRSPKAGGSKTVKPTPTSQTAAAKRRSTMNSRDRAYDDEQLLRAIEASKEDAPLDVPEPTTRRAKRGRSDSEESIAVESQPQNEKPITLRTAPSIKRQRTNSRSVSPPPKPVAVPSLPDSDDEAIAAKKARNNKPLKKDTEAEDKERQRQEAANKRNGRAERRRGEDSDPTEEILPTIISLPPPTQSVEPPTPKESPAPPERIPDTPPASSQPPTSSHKRGARAQQKRTKGRNQYTRDREGDQSQSPARSMSRDVQRNGDESVTVGFSKSSGEQKTGSRSKSAMATKLSMLDMKRRVGAIMDFISRTQLDLAAESVTLPTRSNSEQSSPQETPAPEGSSTSERQANAAYETRNTPDSSHEKDFKELNCMEMMDVLTRDMVKWQNHYA